MLQESDNLWWDAFATEFFEDEATLTLTFCLEDGPKRYSKYFFINNINLRIFYHINWGMFFK
jgi:LIM domain-binding protein 1